MTLAYRNWVPKDSETLVRITTRTVKASDDIKDAIDMLAHQNRVIHEADCFNLNPATNVMTPKV